MPKTNFEISAGRLGMNRDVHPSDLTQEQYTFQMNGNIQNADGNGLPKLQDEPSNLLCSTFKDGYKVVGTKLDLNSDRQYFFLTNPTTGFSEIGYISSISNITNVTDLDASCGCDFKKILSTPLEDTTQTSSCTYVTILEDTCNQCLNFSIDNPIRDIELKDEKCGKRLYFTDGVNSMRYLDLSNLDQYLYTGQELCGDDNTVPTCLDCDKLRVFPYFDPACITPTSIQLGGNLKRGTYEFLIAYADKQGNEITEYTSITNPISIFDQNSVVMDQTELDARTNFGIRLRISDLDNKFGYYKIAVIQRTSVDGAESYFIEGVHPITDDEIVYYTEQGKERTTLNELLVPRVSYTTAQGVTQSNNYLIWNGLTAEKEYNLQPVVNLLGGFLRWKTIKANEDLYSDGISTSLYRGYMRDENYTFGIRFRGRNGYLTSVFPFVGRPADDTDREIIANTDRDSIESFGSDCQDNTREERWQFYNTATNLGLCPDAIGNIDTTTELINAQCSTAAIANSGSGTLNIVCTEPFVDLLTYINTYQTEICDVADPRYNAFICNFLQANYSAFQCSDPTALFNSNCDTGSITEVSSGVSISSVTNENSVINYIPIGDYPTTPPPNVCNEFYPGPVRDTAFEAIYTDAGIVFERNPELGNVDCNNPSQVLDVVYATGGLISYHLNYYGDTSSAANLQLSQTSACATNGFTTQLHRGALWFELNFEGKDSVIFEVTKGASCAETDIIPIGRDLRVTTFNDCTGPAHVECSQVDLDTGLLIQLDRSNYTSDTIYIAIDAPIDTRNLIGPPAAQVHIVTPPCGCFNVTKRDLECDTVDVNYDDLILDKVQVFQAPCEVEVPSSSGCVPESYEYGKFGYFESTEEYPDNEELYNSSDLIIRNINIPVDYRTEFATYYSDGVVGQLHSLKTDTDFRCTPIRLFKMPDFCVSPFMTDQPSSSSASSTIYPLGVTIDENLIEAFLDIARNNDLITQDQRDAITGYEIVRGDRTLHKSIISKGLMFDTYKYDEDVLNDSEVFYPNYPYNDLSADDLNYQTANGVNIPHPFNGTQNNRFTFHGPDTSFQKPTLPTEVKIEAYQYGTSNGRFSEVLGHSKHVILGDDAYTTATALAIAEVAFETLIKIGELTIAAAANSYIGTWAGTSSGVLQNVGGAAVSAAVIAGAVGAFASAFFRVGELRYQWLQTFRDNGRPTNFASYYSSEGNYNYALCNNDEGDMIRGLAAKKYMKPGFVQFNEGITNRKIKVNNLDREESVFLSFGDNFLLNYPAAYTGFDNSRTYWGEVGNGIDCENINVSPVFSRNIASPYVALRNYVPNQYGDIQSIKWLTTGYCGDLDTLVECPSIFGGDIFISRFSFKRKIPLFLSNAVGVADRTPFNYYSQRNIGFPRFYVDYEAPVDTTVVGQIFPNLESDYSFDCLNGENSFYVRPPSKFYLYYYGIPQYLVESEINLNHRYAGKEAYQDFYPHVGDYVDWTQETNISIRRKNEYRYNNTYSKNVTRSAYRTLPDTYDKETYDCLYDAPNGAINSLADNSEQDISDPWLIYKPLDFGQFSTSLGRLVDLTNIESAQVLGRFENGFLLFNAIDVLRERITPETAALGTGGIFASRPLEFKRTQLGYAGTQHRAIVSCEFGHFWADVKRGQVFQVDQNGKNLKEITTGLRNWFKEHLPFKILKSNIDGLTEDDLDNSYKGLGISMGWDSRYRRVFFTKLDYRVLDTVTGTVTYDEGQFFLDGVEIDITNRDVFEDCSFTVAYSPVTESWISYYGFYPNYYVSYYNYFQTGLNYSSDDSELGLWSHVLTNRSFNVFYGKKQDWTIELPIKEDFSNKVLHTVRYWMDSRRYHNEYDFAENRLVGFDSAVIYNHSNNSGVLNLVPEIKNDLSQKLNYPIQNASSTDILATEYDKEWSFNYFYNRVRDEYNNVPIWLNDCNVINKTINTQALDFKQTWLDRIRGDWFLLRLTKSGNSNFNSIFKWVTVKDVIYNE